MGDQYEASRNAEVWEEWYERIGNLLRQGMSCIADATNLSSHHRYNLRELAETHKASTHAIIFRNIGQAVYRNQQRNGTSQGSQKIPDAAMINFVMLYEQMLVHIETETYTSVTYIERTV